jgi:hypothetical protein
LTVTTAAWPPLPTVVGTWWARREKLAPVWAS